MNGRRIQAWPLEDVRGIFIVGRIACYTWICVFLLFYIITRHGSYFDDGRVKGGCEMKRGPIVSTWCVHRGKVWWKVYSSFAALHAVKLPSITARCHFFGQGEREDHSLFEKTLLFLFRSGLIPANKASRVRSVLKRCERFVRVSAKLFPFLSFFSFFFFLFTQLKSHRR